MPDNGPIVLADQQGTPVEITLTPTKVAGGVAHYKDLDEVAEVGRSTLTMKMDEKPTLRKCNIVIRFPRLVTEVINSVNHYSAKDFVTWKIEGFLPHTWSKADLTQRREWAMAAIDDALVRAIADDGVYPS